MKLSDVRLVAAYVAGRVFDVIAPPVFGPRQVWGPADPAGGLGRVEADDEVWEPLGEHPPLSAADVSAGGVETPDSATGGHPGTWTDSELLWHVALLLRGYTVLMVKYGQDASRVDAVRAEVAHRATQFEAEGD